MKGNKNEDLNNSEDNNKQNENEKNDKITEEKIINKDENEGGTLSCELIKDELASHDMIFKIIVIGDSFVGKSCITTRATKDIYENYYTTAVGFEFFTLQYRINSQNIKLQIWDTCGQEEYRSLIQNFYRNSSLAILVYSINSRNSFDNLGVWLNEIRTKGNPDVKIFLVGNKIDLENERVISTTEGQQFYESQKLNLFIETSAKNGNNIQELFQKAAILLYQEHASYKDRASRVDNTIRLPFPGDENQNPMDNDDEVERKKKCCK